MSEENKSPAETHSGTVQAFTVKSFAFALIPPLLTFFATFLILKKFTIQERLFLAAPVFYGTLFLSFLWLWVDRKETGGAKWAFTVKTLLFGGLGIALAFYPAFLVGSFMDKALFYADGFLVGVFASFLFNWIAREREDEGEPEEASGFNVKSLAFSFVGSLIVAAVIGVAGGLNFGVPLLLKFHAPVIVFFAVFCVSLVWDRLSVGFKLKPLELGTGLFIMVSVLFLSSVWMPCFKLVNQLIVDRLVLTAAVFGVVAVLGLFLKWLSGDGSGSFTIKSLSFGLLGILIVAGLSYFSDNRLKQTLMVGNHFPISAFFFVFILALFWNWVATCRTPERLHRWFVLRSGELAVTLGITLVSCWVPTSGLYRYFHRLLVLPWYFLPQKSQWTKMGILDYLPAKLFPLGDRLHEIIQKTVVSEGNLGDLDPSLKVLYEKVYMGFVLGLQKGDSLVWDFPLKEWLPPMMYWGPLLILFAAAVIGLTLLVHRQWVHHEQLSYPLASIANSLVKTSKGRAFSDIFSNRLFWWGVCPVLGIYLINYLHLWFPESMPDISLSWSCVDGLNKLFPVLKQAEEAGTIIGSGTLFFTIVGICFFIPGEVALSMGLAVPLLVFLGVQYYLMTGMPIPGQEQGHFRTGAYIGYALILLYTGRTYYFPVILKALGIGKVQQANERESVLAARIFMLGFIGMIGMLMTMGLNWLVAFVFTLLVMLMFLVFTRIVCETGIPFLQPYWFPGYFMTDLLGPAAIGAGPMVIIYYLGAIFCQDPRECLMPYAATSFKVAEDNNVGKSRLLSVLMVSVVIALAVGFIVTLWSIYNFGALSFDRWANYYPPRIYFDQAVNKIGFLEDTGQLAANTAASPLARLADISLGGSVLGWAGAGLLCVLIFSALRFRFSKCPIHPVLFLVIGTFPIRATYASFIIGWAVKQLVVKFGGGKAYQDLKPLFIGMIMGELIAGGLSIVTGFIYYLATGNLPVALTILPG